jgi:hypothetical protein
MTVLYRQWFTRVLSCESLKIMMETKRKTAVMVKDKIWGILYHRFTEPDSKNMNDELCNPYV